MQVTIQTSVQSYKRILVTTHTTKMEYKISNKKKVTKNEKLTVRNTCIAENIGNIITKDSNAELSRRSSDGLGE